MGLIQIINFEKFTLYDDSVITTSNETIQLPEQFPRVKKIVNERRKYTNFSSWLNYVEEVNRSPFKDKLTFVKH